MAGDYVGEYDALFADAISMLPVPVIGPLVMALEAGEAIPGPVDPDVFEIPTFELVEGATLTANWGGEALVNLRAELEGGVDCGTGDFEATSVHCEGTVAGLPFNCGPMVLLGSFDPATGAIAGTFTGPSDWGDAEGDFSMSLQAP